MKKIAFKSVSILTTFCLILCILVLSAALAFTYRLSKGPVDLAFAKDRIEQAINDGSNDLRISSRVLQLEWSTYKNALVLSFQGIDIYQTLENTQNEQDALKIEKAQLGLSIPSLLVGKIKPQFLIIDAPVLQFTVRDGRYEFAHTFSNSEQSEEQSKENLDWRSEIINTLSDIASSKSKDFAILSELDEVILSRAILKQVIVEAAPVVMSYSVGTEALIDLTLDSFVDDVIQEIVMTQQDYIALFDLVLGRSEEGLEATISLDLPGTEGHAASVRTDIVFRTEQKDLTVNGSFKNINPAQFDFLPFEMPLMAQQDLLLGGTIQAALDRKLNIENAAFSLSMPEGVFSYPQEYDEDIAIKDVVASIKWLGLEEKLTLQNFSANIGDITFRGEGEGKLNRQEFSLPLKVMIEETTTDHFPKFLPKSFQEETLAEWVNGKLKNGTLKNILLTTQAKGQKNNESSWEVDFDGPIVDFDFEGLDVHYSETLMPATESIGKGRYQDDTLTITGESGKIGDVLGSDLNMVMTNLSVKGGGKAHITLKGKGPLKTVLTYIQDEPIALGYDEIGIEAAQTSGLISFDLDLKFPTVKGLPKEEVNVIIDGTLSNIRLPEIVRGLDLTGGPYTLNYKQGKVTLKGKGQLSGRDINLDYQQYLDPVGQPFDLKVTANLLADQQLRDAFGIGLEDYLSGNLPIDVVYTQAADGSARIAAKGNLTPAILTIEPFGFSKQQGIEGQYSLNAYMTKDRLTEVDNLNVSTQGFRLENGRLLFRPLGNDEVDVARGSIQKAVIGRTQAKVDFEVTPENTLKVITNGPVLDLAPFIDKDKKNDKSWKDPQENEGQKMQLSLKADRAFTNEDQFLKQSQFYIETDKDSDITRLEVDAKVGQNADFYVRFKPEGGTGERTFRLESTDAGATLKTFDLYEDMIGGSMLVYGRPQRGDNEGDLFGTARIENFTVKEAPVLARLLGALSQNGIQDALNTKGVSFSKLESKFEWRFRDDGNLLVVKEGRTSGSSLGLTFEGVVQVAKGVLDISGTVIPLSGINKAIGDIPIIGNILTGGSAGGLIAATYTISGQASDSKVVVNPLSILAPGFLRRILFEGGFESKLPENKPVTSGVNE